MAGKGKKRDQVLGGLMGQLINTMIHLRKLIVDQRSLGADFQCANIV